MWEPLKFVGNAVVGSIAMQIKNVDGWDNQSSDASGYVGQVAKNHRETYSQRHWSEQKLQPLVA